MERELRARLDAALRYDYVARELGVTVQMDGLRALPIGNGSFGEDSRADDNAVRPGDPLCADVPVPACEGLMDGRLAGTSAWLPPPPFTAPSSTTSDS